MRNLRVISILHNPDYHYFGALEFLVKNAFANNGFLKRVIDIEKLAEAFYQTLGLPETNKKYGLKEGAEFENGEIVFGFPLIWKEDVAVEGKIRAPHEKVFKLVDNFFQALKKIASENYIKNGEGFVRPIGIPKGGCPPGHNKLDIKPSKIMSALLYED